MISLNTAVAAYFDKVGGAKGLAKIAIELPKNRNDVSAAIKKANNSSSPNHAYAFSLCWEVSLTTLMERIRELPLSADPIIEEARRELSSKLFALRCNAAFEKAEDAGRLFTNDVEMSSLLTVILDPKCSSYKKGNVRKDLRAQVASRLYTIAKIAFPGESEVETDLKSIFQRNEDAFASMTLNALNTQKRKRNQESRDSYNAKRRAARKESNDKAEKMRKEAASAEVELASAIESGDEDAIKKAEQARDMAVEAMDDAIKDSYNAKRRAARKESNDKAEKMRKESASAEVELASAIKSGDEDAIKKAEQERDKAVEAMNDVVVRRQESRDSYNAKRRAARKESNDKVEKMRKEVSAAEVELATAIESGDEDAIKKAEQERDMAVEAMNDVVVRRQESRDSHNAKQRATRKESNDKAEKMRKEASAAKVELARAIKSGDEDAIKKAEQARDMAVEAMDDAIKDSYNAKQRATRKESNDKAEKMRKEASAAKVELARAIKSGDEDAIKKAEQARDMAVDAMSDAIKDSYNEKRRVKCKESNDKAEKMRKEASAAEVALARAIESGNEDAIEEAERTRDKAVEAMDDAIKNSDKEKQRVRYQKSRHHDRSSIIARAKKVAAKQTNVTQTERGVEIGQIIRKGLSCGKTISIILAELKRSRN